MPLADVTILLSLTVFMNRVSAVMPTTSDAIPLIGKESNNQTDKKSYLSFAHKPKSQSLLPDFLQMTIFFIYVFYITVSQIKPNLNTTFFLQVHNFAI